MPRKQSSDDRLERNDLFEDDQRSSSDDSPGDDDCSCDDGLRTSRLERGGQRKERGRGRGRGRGRSSDDDNNWSDNSDDPVTGRRTQRLGGSQKGYTFEADDDGKVTLLMRVRRGRTEREKIEAGETWNYNSQSRELIHREPQPSGTTEVTIYTDLNRDDIFTCSSKTFESTAAFGVDML